MKFLFVGQDLHDLKCVFHLSPFHLTASHLWIPITLQMTHIFCFAARLKSVLPVPPLPLHCGRPGKRRKRKGSLSEQSILSQGSCFLPSPPPPLSSSFFVFILLLLLLRQVSGTPDLNSSVSNQG